MESPKEIIARAKACFETLLRMYYLRHGFETYDFSLFQYLPLLAFSSLRDVEDVSTPVEEQQGLRSTLLLSAKGLWEQGRNMAICKPMFSQLRDAVKDPELQREISQFADNTLDEGLLRRELRSKWPIGQFNIQSGFTALSVTDYLRQSKATHRGAEGTNSSEVVEILE